MYNKYIRIKTDNNRIEKTKNNNDETNDEKGEDEDKV